MDLIPQFAETVRIIPSPEVTVVDVEHTFTCVIHFICPHNIMKIEHTSICVVITIRKIESVEDDCLETMCDPRVLVLNQPNSMKYFEGPRLG
jgi:hypothetical protein